MKPLSPTVIGKLASKPSSHWSIKCLNFFILGNVHQITNRPIHSAIDRLIEKLTNRGWWTKNSSSHSLVEGDKSFLTVLFISSSDVVPYDF